MPLTEVFFALHSGLFLNRTIVMPIIVRIIPIQLLVDRRSFRNKNAKSAVMIGIKVVKSIAMVALSLFMAIKKNVSPSDIPSIPLIIRKNNVLFSIGSNPLISNTIYIHNMAMKLLPIFIPMAETSRPIFL